MKMTWDQVLAWRLERQFVDPCSDGAVGEIVSRLCGVQAQVGSAAQLAVALRQCSPQLDGVSAGLDDGSLVKTWAMRGTLHVCRSSEVGAYLSLIASARTWARPVWQRSFGASPDEVDALAEAVSEILDGAVLTREELVARLVADARFARLEEALRSGWGALLKPLAWQGALCYGPSQGTKVAFTHPVTAIAGWREPPAPDEAAPVVIAAYLGAYGPSTPERFDAWLSRNSLRKTVVRGWFQAMGDRLVEVDVAGEPRFILAEHADALGACTPRSSVRLLGGFDQYVLGPGTNEAAMLPSEHRPKVSRAAGWISPVVVVGGRVVGVWELSDDAVVVTMFPGTRTPPKRALATEAARVARASGRAGLEVRMA
jgi:Winged helix DNA-binding domain